MIELVIKFLYEKTEMTEYYMKVQPQNKFSTPKKNDYKLLF